MTGLRLASPGRRTAAKRRWSGHLRSPLVAGAMIIPFLALAAFAMAAPVGMLLLEAFRDAAGFTFGNVAALARPAYRLAAWNSVTLSLASALLSLAAGAALAFVAGREGSRLGTAVASFSAVAAHFGGVPLAFAFVSSLGFQGLLTRGLKAIGLDFYAIGFSLYSLAGLTIVYAYFLTPLAILVLGPSIRALRADWLLAATSLGATPGQRLRLVILPILAPSLVSSFLLLFGSALSGYATAYALTSGNIVLLTTEIGNVLSGDVASAPGIGAALSLAMIAIMTLLLLLARRFNRRAWTRPR
ncbi:ABC transporter [Aureimonas endophytica]|uniref:ABC transporter n=1 Tax=Aureimonas endophytica TaxID=2027858 RepID=A0A916ZN57_9HYPH|nr:ABC transporter permease subunit [Aureimonas endophytica]GGE05828.1 ABC transporter [Aureimonas endophytica]